MDDRSRFSLPFLFGASAELLLIALAGFAAFKLDDAPWAIVAVLVIAAIALAIRMIGAILQHRRFSIPLAALAKTLDRLGNNDWSARVQPDGASAVKDVAFNLNLLAQQTQTQLVDLRTQRNDLIDLIDALPDPIVRADSQQRVSQLNGPAAVLLSVTARQARGQLVVGVVGESSLVELCEQLPINPGAMLMREITLTRVGQKLVYQAVAARTSDGGLLLTLRDITQLTAAVQMKTDFVANASHELRTPIAAIKIAVDTLQDVYTDDPQQTLRCFDIIAGHMKRLEDMLQDLLDLSRVENAEIKPEWTSLPASEILATLRIAMGSQAEAKGVQFETIDQCPEPLITERRLLDLMLKNLAENAVKFTPASGKVTVTIQRQPGGDVAIRVADTGIGIPPQHLERVFERFYQVDSARSGTSGRGTGLGLAIVKHAVAVLGGQVNVESQVGRGTTFTCVLPQQHVTPMMSN